MMLKNKRYTYKDPGPSVGRSAALIKLSLILVVVMVVMISLTMLARLEALNAEKEALAAEIAEKRERIEELNYFIESPIDREYIVRVAREKLGLVFPDDEVYYTGTGK